MKKGGGRCVVYEAETLAAGRGGLFDPRVWWSVSLIELDVDQARLRPEGGSDSTDKSGVRLRMHDGCSVRVN